MTWLCKKHNTTQDDNHPCVGCEEQEADAIPLVTPTVVDKKVSPFCVCEGDHHLANGKCHNCGKWKAA